MFGVDGTELEANAGKHAAMSYGHTVKIPEPLECGV